MAFVRQLEDGEIPSELHPLYAQLREYYGVLPDYFRTVAQVPASVPQQAALGAALMQDGRLPADLKARIVLVVSGINSSSYCVAAHMELLRKLGIEKPLGRKLATDPQNAPVSAEEKALFGYAEALTRRPADVTAADVAAVRAAGWDEVALIETVMLVAWGNFINRVTLGLGLMAEY